MRGLRLGVAIQIPEGWDMIAFFDRIIDAKLCTYADLQNGSVSIKDVYEMHRMVDWRDYAHAKAEGKRKAVNGKGR